MATECKTCDIQTWNKHLFLDMTSTNTDTLVHLLYQCIKIHSIEVFWPLSQQLPHLRFNLFVISRTYGTQL
jgi:hypothetical protein